MWDLGLVLVAGLAAFRLWVLISSDSILDPVRDRLPVDFRVGFLSCPWCSGFWVAVGVYLAVEVWGDGAWLQTGLVVLALSAVVGIAAVVVDGGDG